MRFYCPQKNCKYNKDTQLENALEAGVVELDISKLGHSYDRALLHAQRCPYKEYPCELGCGTMLVNAAKADHLKKCVNYEEICNNCECVFRPNQTGGTSLSSGHNCLDILKSKYQNNEETMNAMDW